MTSLHERAKKMGYEISIHHNGERQIILYDKPLDQSRVMLETNDTPADFVDVTYQRRVAFTGSGEEGNILMYGLQEAHQEARKVFDLGRIMLWEEGFQTKFREYDEGVEIAGKQRMTEDRFERLLEVILEE